MTKTYKNQKNTIIKSLCILACLIFSYQTAIAQEEEKKEKDTTRGLGKEYQITTTYVHNWIKFWPFSGKRVQGGRKYSYTPKDNKAAVVVFLASWDLSSQRLIRRVLELEKAYKAKHTEFVYVFSHDTQKDAHNFIDYMKMNDSTSILANQKLLQKFKEPELMSIYVADRNHWLVLRYIDVKKKELSALDDFLRGINSM